MQFLKNSQTAKMLVKVFKLKLNHDENMKNCFIGKEHQFTSSFMKKYSMDFHSNKKMNPNVNVKKYWCTHKILLTTISLNISMIMERFLTRWLLLWPGGKTHVSPTLTWVRLHHLGSTSTHGESCLGTGVETGLCWSCRCSWRTQWGCQACSRRCCCNSRVGQTTQFTTATSSTTPQSCLLGTTWSWSSTSISIMMIIIIVMTNYM